MLSFSSMLPGRVLGWEKMHLRNANDQAGKTATWSRALAVPTEDMGSSPSTHGGSQASVTPILEILQTLCAHHITHTCTHAHKKINKILYNSHDFISFVT